MLHIRPYDKKGQKFRREFGEELQRISDESQVDIWVLSNFKKYLHDDTVNNFQGIIINFHPSFLPELKGYRTEDLGVNQGIAPDAVGYTVHLVIPELDGGPTLFQQRVEFPPYDEELAKLMEVKYEEKREEYMRRNIMKAQAEWTAKITAIISAGLETKIVYEKEAFIVEGREDFWMSEDHIKSLKSDYKKWCRKNRNSEVTYENWYKNERIPYGRVLFNFKNGKGFVRLEDALGATEYSSRPHEDLMTVYEFIIEGESLRMMEAVNRLLRDWTEEIKTDYPPNYEWSILSNDGETARAKCFVTCSDDRFKAFLFKKGIKFNYKIPTVMDVEIREGIDRDVRLWDDLPSNYIDDIYIHGSFENDPIFSLTPTIWTPQTITNWESLKIHRPTIKELYRFHNNLTTA